MNEKLKKIYDLLYSPILTPYNLLENAKLSNYSYVNYYKNNTGLIAEMKCIMEENSKEMIFYYHFDKNDFLSKIYQEDMVYHNKILIYDRAKEIISEKENLLNNKATKKLQTA